MKIWLKMMYFLISSKYLNNYIIILYFLVFRESDLKNLDAKLKALENDDDDEEEDGKESDSEEDISPQKLSKAKKSVVDDKFFSLREMEKFLDEQEKNGTEISDLEDIDDEDFETDYRYKDFFEESTSSKFVIYVEIYRYNMFSG